MGLPPNASSIASAIGAARDYLAAHVDEARSRDSVARATLEQGLRVRVEGPNGWRIDTDMATAVGGEGSAPSPGWILRAALASCDAVLIAMQCAEEGVSLASLEAEVSSESDDRGLLGGSTGDVPAGPLSIRTDVSYLADGITREQFEGIVERALRRSPVADALRRPIPVEVTIVEAHAASG
jgi:uncharacterized OsmC-like protein